jgi:glucose/arabinose dehydrogenase/cytochrome c5
MKDPSLIHEVEVTPETSPFKRSLFSAAAVLFATVAAVAVFQSLPAQTSSFHGAPDTAAATENPHTSAQDLEAGQAVFKKNCAVCHGAVGQGIGNVPSLAKGSAQSAKAGELFWFITKGDIPNAMPSWAQLPEEQRWQVVSFLHHLPSLGAAQPAPAPEAADAKVFTAPPSIPPFTDFRVEKPGVFRKITVADLPAPFATKSAGNGPRIVARPEGVWPQALPGFKVELYASGLDNPRLIRTAPNGDYFLAETGKGRIVVFRGITADGKPEITSIFAEGLHAPFGIAFYPKGPNPQWIYIGDIDAVVRIPYHNGDLKASGPPEHLADLPSGGGHTTRDVRFTPDDSKMLVSVGSASNVDDPDTHPAETDRADVLEFNPDGSGKRIYAYGIRNCVGEAINPLTGELWCSVNERDALGDNLVPDYITHVQPGGFYGWPWWYMGAHQDPRHEGKHPELRDKVIVPDVLLNPHNASLEMTFYDGKQFPAEYSGDIFASEHGSWNRSARVGYEVIRVPLHQTGHATGEYEDFLTGFVLPSGDAWGRPVGVTVATDGSLLVSDDGSNSIWRVSYTGK